MFAALAAIFFLMLGLTVTLAAVTLFCLVTGRSHPVGRRAGAVLGGMYAAYGLFAVLGTGPMPWDQDRMEELTQPALYRAPWPAQQVSCVAQGHRSLVSHRGSHLFALDFLRPLGTPVLAAREGRVVDVDDTRSGVGWFEGNQVTVEHSDHTQALYAHVARGSATVSVGDAVVAGQHIADIGMVGKTLFPHLHFVVFDGHGESVPVRFRDIDRPLAGRCYAAW